MGHTGKYPTLGNGTFDHLRDIPFEELPSIIIPRASSEAKHGAFVAAANNKIYPDGYRYSLGHDFATPYREARIQSLLSANTKNLSHVAFHMKVQSDVRSNMWTDTIDRTTKSCG